MRPTTLIEPVYIFLDIDGVANSKRSLVAFGNYMDESLDPLAFRLVNTLFKKLRLAGVEPRLVISSTWRISHPVLEWWQDVLRPYPDIYLDGLNPIIDGQGVRDLECMQYLTNAGQTKAPWVALDDGIIGDVYPERGVLVDSNIGLDTSDIDEAFYILTGGTLIPGGFANSGKWASLRKWNRHHV